MSPETVRSWPDPATILEQSKGVFFAQWEELLRLRRAVLKTSDPDDIHDLRVASRRFRAALELFAPVSSSIPKSKLKKCVRRLTRSLGGLRNVDEALLFFQSRTCSDISGNARFYNALSDMRPNELKLIKKALRAFDHTKLDRKVHKMVAGFNWDGTVDGKSRSLPDYFSDASVRLYQPIHQLFAVSSATENRESRHALRIAIKKWRYFFELVAHILSRDYSEILEMLKEYQSLLGRMNDVAVFEVMLAEIKLPPDERQYFENILQSEDAILLKSFRELVELKPLKYTDTGGERFSAHAQMIFRQ